jgi:hypothetical protein
MMSLGRSKALAALGLIFTLAIAAVALVTQTRQAQASSNAVGPWSDSLAEYGMPATPAMWNPSNFDVQIHTRDMQSGSGNDSHLADHGADCGAPPATHMVSGWQQAVFVCHNHVMTSIKSDGYGLITMTPDHLADWSDAAVTIGFSVSTFQTDPRDWITVDVTPFAEQLALPFNEGEVDLQGMPAHYVELKTDVFNGKTQWKAFEGPGRFCGSFCALNAGAESTAFTAQTGITPSKTVRTPFEFTFDRTSYTFRVAANAPAGAGKVLLAGRWPQPLSFSQGVVQFSQHSYNPDKCDTGVIDSTRCEAGTWHWSDFSISRAVAYTLLRPTDLPVVKQPGGSISFGAPAPAGGYLKFAAIGSAQVSYDGGKTFAPAQKPPMDASLFHEEHFTSYLTPVPAGTRNVQFKLAGGWYGSGMARDFSIVSLAANGSPPPTQPPGPQPTATQPSGSTLVPLNNTQCMVMINGAMQNGTCSGTFNPSK